MQTENKNNSSKISENGGLYSKINMSVKTADIIISVLIFAIVVTVIIALNM